MQAPIATAPECNVAGRPTPRLPAQKQQKHDSRSTARPRNSRRSVFLDPINLQAPQQARSQARPRTVLPERGAVKGDFAMLTFTLLVSLLMPSGEVQSLLLGEGMTREKCDREAVRAQVQLTDTLSVAQLVEIRCAPAFEA